MVSLLCPFICDKWTGVSNTILMFLWGSIPMSALSVEMFYYRTDNMNDYGPKLMFIGLN